MRIGKDEALRMALALDVAITCMEFDGADLAPGYVLPKGITKSLKQDSLIHLRELRSAALRANREPAPPTIPEELPFFRTQDQR
jgi:hypothetical protein